MSIHYHPQYHIYLLRVRGKRALVCEARRGRAAGGVVLELVEEGDER